MSIEINNDITIIGGGIAGLWIANVLNNLGYNTILIEKNAFGSFQTINSQGIIHGGIKYSLVGKISNTTHNISEMPSYWENSLKNNLKEPFLLNLNKTKINSHFHDLAFPKSITAKFKSLVTANLLVSSGDIIKSNDVNYQQSLNNFGFNGVVYRINEQVLDIPSLLKNLSESIKDKCLYLKNYDLLFNNSSKNSIKSILFEKNNEFFEIKSKLYIFTSGSSNNALLEGINPYKQQIRPLHMLYALPDTCESLFAHFIDTKLFSNKPIMTITTHKNKKLNRNILYFGGAVAESNHISTTKDLHINNLKKTINQIFPKLNTLNWQWGTKKLERAELEDSQNLMPNTASIIENENYLIAWPTKLTFAPDLAKQVLNILDKINLKPNCSTSSNSYNSFSSSSYNFLNPTVAKPCYENFN